MRTDLSGEAFLVQTTTPADIVVPVGVIALAQSLGVYDQTLGFTEDYGDLFVDGAFNYPTTEAEGGASHTVVAGVRLGDSVDADPGTLTSIDATADDDAISDDEDGVTLVSTAILPNSTIEIDVFAVDDAGAGAVLNVWIDFNDDGDWDDAGEHLVVDRAVVSGITTTLSESTPADVAASGELLATRFRWGASGLDYDGAAAFGEVEDYLFPTNSLINQDLDPADYNGDGVVDEADRDTWELDYGATSGIALRSDGNDNGVVDSADYVLWREAYATAPALIVQPAAAGDYNADGDVDGDDFDAFTDTYGSTDDPSADGNGDGVVSALDYLVWREAEETAAASQLVVDASTAITPEAVAQASVVDSVLAVEAADDSASESDAVDHALLLLDDVVADEQGDSEVAPLTADDEDESLELALDEGLLAAI